MGRYHYCIFILFPFHRPNNDWMHVLMIWVTALWSSSNTKTRFDVFHKVCKRCETRHVRIKWDARPEGVLNTKEELVTFSMHVFFSWVWGYVLFSIGTYIFISVWVLVLGLFWGRNLTVRAVVLTVVKRSPVVRYNHQLLDVTLETKKQTINPPDNKTKQTEKHEERENIRVCSDAQTQLYCSLYYIYSGTCTTLHQ